MATEARIQAKLINYLKSKGCYVIKTRPGTPGIPTGCPDIIALYEGFWAVFECKASRTSSFQPLQKETLARLADWSYAYVVYPENYDDVIAELERML